jgi:hypothetical protein
MTNLIKIKLNYKRNNFICCFYKLIIQNAFFFIQRLSRLKPIRQAALTDKPKNTHKHYRLHEKTSKLRVVWQGVCKVSQECLQTSPDKRDVVAWCDVPILQSVDSETSQFFLFCFAGTAYSCAQFYFFSMRTLVKNGYFRVLILYFEN